MKQIENSPVKTQYNQITNRQASTIDSLDQANTARSPSTERYLAAQRTRLYSPIHNRPQDDRTPVPMQSTRARALMSPKLKAIFGRVGSGLIRRSNESPLSSKYR